METHELLRHFRSERGKEIAKKFHIHTDAKTGQLSPYRIGGGDRFSVFGIKDTKRDLWYALRISEDRSSYNVLHGKYREGGDKKDGELHILQKLKGVDGFVQIIDGPFDLAEYVSFILLEKGDTNLHTLIEDKGVFQEDKIIDMATYLSKTLQKAHQLGVFHRDIKARNVIMFDDIAKWCDLSEAGVVGSGSTVISKGTATELAPEVLLDPEKAKTEVAENYPVGALMYHMAIGKRPYWDVDLSDFADLSDKIGFTGLAERKSDRGDLEQRMKLLDSAENITDHVRSVIRVCMDPDPSKRYTTTQDLIDALDKEYVGARGKAESLYNTALAELQKAIKAPKDSYGVVKTPESLQAAMAAAGDYAKYVQDNNLRGRGNTDKMTNDLGAKVNQLKEGQKTGVARVFYVNEKTPDDKQVEEAIAHIDKMLAGGKIKPDALKEIKQRYQIVVDILNI
ncbi:protein kinase [candidate division KSB1 bacterium]